MSETGEREAFDWTLPPEEVVRHEECPKCAAHVDQAGPIAPFVTKCPNGHWVPLS